eukprot:6226835-Amphidinium_carterae.1
MSPRGWMPQPEYVKCTVTKPILRLHERQHAHASPVSVVVELPLLDVERARNTRGFSVLNLDAEMTWTMET